MIKFTALPSELLFQLFISYEPCLYQANMPGGGAAQNPKVQKPKSSPTALLADNVVVASLVSRIFGISITGLYQRGQVKKRHP